MKKYNKYVPFALSINDLISWLSIILVFVISFFNVVGWVFNISLLKGFLPYGTAMRLITALCFIVSGQALIFLKSKKTGRWSLLIPKLSGTIVALIGLLTMLVYFIHMKTGRESAICNLPVLHVFLGKDTRMALITAFLFLFTGVVLVILTINSHRAVGLAHALILPVLITSYIIPVSYILGVHFMSSFLNLPVAVNTGITFCILCMGIFFVYPDSWFMKVFRSNHAGGIMARRLLPGIVVTPLIIGWLRVYGERAGVFGSEVGIVFVAVTYTFCFLGLVWWTAKSVNKIDKAQRSLDASLRISEERYRNLFEYSALPVWEVDFSEIRMYFDILLNSGIYDFRAYFESHSEEVKFLISHVKIIDINLKSVDFFEAKHKQEVISTFFSLFNEDSISIFKEEIIALAEGKYRFESEMPIQTFAGNIKHLIFHLSVMPEYENSLAKVLITFNDITERKLMEEEIKNSKDEWVKTFDLIPDLIAILDDKHRIIKANKAMAEKLNTTSDKVTGLHCYNCIHGADAPPSFCPHSMMLLDNKQHLTEVYEIRLGGDFLVSVTPILDEKGNFKGGVHVARDITERKKAERELRESEKKLKLAIENGNIGIWEWNITSGQMLWNDRMEQMFGLKKETFGKTFEEFEKFIHEEDVPHLKKAMKKAIEEELPFETVFRIKSSSGESKFINAKGIVEKDNNRKTTGMIGVCFDITEMKKGAELALFNVNEELLRSNKDLQQFAYVASHDLQEPLRMISSFTQLLAQRYKDKLDKDANEFIDFTIDGAKRMQNLINDLLTYSRIQTKGKEFVNVNMNELLKEVIRNLSIRINALEAIVTCDELPTLAIDEGQMAQVLQNLITNALKFSKHKPEIHISKKEENNHYVFSVKDNGIGIEKQYFERIFQIFQRLVPKEEYEGTGIGLSICKRIVERHGGKIWVESEFGKGSTFYFTIIKDKDSVRFL